MSFIKTNDFDNLKIESPIWRAIRRSPDGYQWIDMESMGNNGQAAIEHAKWVEESRLVPGFYKANPIIGAIKTAVIVEGCDVPNF